MDATQVVSSEIYSSKKSKVIELPLRFVESIQNASTEISVGDLPPEVSNIGCI